MAAPGVIVLRMLSWIRKRIPARITGRLAPVAAALTVACTPVTAPAPAPSAAEVALSLDDVPSTFVVYNADEGAKATSRDFEVPVHLDPPESGPALDLKVVVDASGLEGIARVADDGNCNGSGWVYTCEYGSPQNDGESYAPFQLLGLDGVTPGDSGTVTYTASADNAPPVTGTTRMVIGGPTLGAPDEELEVSGVVPGRDTPLTPKFANRTRFSADRGVALRVEAAGGLTLEPRHGNCSYDAATPTSAWCLFPAGAAPRTAYRTRAPLTYVARDEQLTGTITYSWSSTPEKPAGHPVRGTGAPLTLTATADEEFGSPSGAVRVNTTVQADYRPVTGTVRGRVGDNVEVRLGVRDLGPGRLVNDEPKGRFEVVPPEGTTVTSIPYAFEDLNRRWGCEQPKGPGGAFVCDLDSEAFSWARQDDGTTVIAFRVRVDRQVTGAHGTIRTYGAYDRTPGNDTAAIPLEASPAPPHRSGLHPVTWAAVAVGAVAAVVLVTGYLRRRRRAG